MSLQQVRKMPLNSIAVSKVQKEWIAAFFVDIAERNAIGLDLEAMLFEAYVLGVHHCMTVNEVDNAL